MDREELFDANIPIVCAWTTDNISAGIACSLDLALHPCDWVSNCYKGSRKEALGVVPHRNCAPGTRQVPVADAVGNSASCVADRERESALESHDGVSLPSTQDAIQITIPVIAETPTPAERKLPASAKAESVTHIKIGSGSHLMERQNAVRADSRSELLVVLVIGGVRDGVAPSIRTEEERPVRHVLAQRCLQAVIEGTESLLMHRLVSPAVYSRLQRFHHVL